MRRVWKVLGIVAATFVVAICIIVPYGIATDCPNTAGYVDCSYNN